MLCPKCNNSGKKRGIGMMDVTCDCQYEEIKTKGESKQVPVDKRSKTYRDAIAQLMVSAKVTREKAVKMFDEEFQKLP
jgi:hypothetical protein